jgi:hypothetical protein
MAASIAALSKRSKPLVVCSSTFAVGHLRLSTPSPPPSLLAQALAHARVLGRWIVQVIGFGGWQLHLRWWSRGVGAGEAGAGAGGGGAGVAAGTAGAVGAAAGAVNTVGGSGMVTGKAGVNTGCTVLGGGVRGTGLGGSGGLSGSGGLGGGGGGGGGGSARLMAMTRHHHVYHALQQTLVQGPQPHQVEQHHADYDDRGASQFQCLCSSAWAAVLGVCT